MRRKPVPALKKAIEEMKKACAKKSEEAFSAALGALSDSKCHCSNASASGGKKS